MKLNSKILGIVILVVIFGGIAASTALGYWSTEGGGGGGFGSSSEAESGETESIRGRTTFKDLLDLGLPQSMIEQVIGGTMPEPLTRVKDYCSLHELEFETIKEALQVELDKR
jgi:hypothetical protein